MADAEKLSYETPPDGPLAAGAPASAVTLEVAEVNVLRVVDEERQRLQVHLLMPQQEHLPRHRCDRQLAAVQRRDARRPRPGGVHELLRLDHQLIARRRGAFD